LAPIKQRNQGEKEKIVKDKNEELSSVGFDGVGGGLINNW
jgi:hypothetical protein